MNVTGPDLAAWSTPLDGERGLACTRGSRAVGCFWDGDHAWAGAGSSAAPLASRWVSPVLASLPSRKEAQPSLPEALGFGFGFGSATGMAVLASVLVLLFFLLAIPNARRETGADDQYVRLL